MFPARVKSSTRATATPIRSAGPGTAGFPKAGPQFARPGAQLREVLLDRLTAAGCLADTKLWLHHLEDFAIRH
eukprot:8110396-Pyramimonas_sp.AAC.1